MYLCVYVSCESRRVMDDWRNHILRLYPPPATTAGAKALVVRKTRAALVFFERLRGLWSILFIINIIIITIMSETFRLSYVLNSSPRATLLFLTSHTKINNNQRWTQPTRRQYSAEWCRPLSPPNEFISYPLKRFAIMRRTITLRRRRVVIVFEIRCSNSS